MSGCWGQGVADWYPQVPLRLRLALGGSRPCDPLPQLPPSPTQLQPLILPEQLGGSLEKKEIPRKGIRVLGEQEAVQDRSRAFPDHGKERK